MRIAVWHNLPSGGGKRALYYHVRGLVERGHTVESWCPSTAAQSYLPLSELIPEHIVPLTWTATSPKTPLERLTLDYYNIVSKLKAMDEHCQYCAEEINAAGFDLLFVNPCRFFRTSSIGKYIKIPKILYLQEPYRVFYEALPSLPWLALPPPKTAWYSLNYLKSFFKDLVKIQGLRVQMREELLNAKAFDRILVNSLFSRESVLRAYGLDSQVCYLGVDSELFRATGVPRENFVMGLGGVYINKGIERAIATLASIPKSQRPDLVWIGNYSDKQYQKEMQQLAQSAGVNLQFKIRIADAELVDCLNRAIALLYTPRLEPFGFAPLEANACGTPVVAIAEGGVREVVKQGINGLLVNDDNPVALGKAILQLLENQDLAQEISARSKQYVWENWTWEAALERLEQTFNSLISSI